MIDLITRLNNIESNLTVVEIEYNKAFKDATVTINDDELTAVRKDIFDRIRSLQERLIILKNQTVLLEDTINAVINKRK